MKSLHVYMQLQDGHAQVESLCKKNLREFLKELYHVSESTEDHGGKEEETILLEHVGIKWFVTYYW